MREGRIPPLKMCLLFSGALSGKQHRAKVHAGAYKPVCTDAVDRPNLRQRQATFCSPSASSTLLCKSEPVPHCVGVA